MVPVCTVRGHCRCQHSGSRGALRPTRFAPRLRSDDGLTPLHGCSDCLSPDDARHSEASVMRDTKPWGTEVSGFCVPSLHRKFNIAADLARPLMNETENLGVRSNEIEIMQADAWLAILCTLQKVSTPNLRRPPRGLVASDQPHGRVAKYSDLDPGGDGR